MGRIHRGAGRRASELSNGIGVPGVQVFFACELCVRSVVLLDHEDLGPARRIL